MYLSIYLFIYLSLYPSMDLSIHPSIYLSEPVARAGRHVVLREEVSPGIDRQSQALPETLRSRDLAETFRSTARAPFIPSPPSEARFQQTQLTKNARNSAINNAGNNGRRTRGSMRGGVSWH